MTCSHCSLQGHTYRRCPTMSDVDKQQKIQDNKAKVIATEERRVIRNQRLEQLRLDEEQRRQEQALLYDKYEVINQNDYEIALYYGKMNGDHPGDVRFFANVEAHGNSRIKLKKGSLRLVIFPQLEVTLPGGLSAFRNINILNESQDRMILLNQEMEDYEGDILIIPRKEYKPPKTELEQWKECALKSNYLLQQIIMLGGGKNENPKLTSYLEERGIEAKRVVGEVMIRYDKALTAEGLPPLWAEFGWEEPDERRASAYRDVSNVKLIDDLVESRKDLIRKNENLEPILDMIEDINIPVHTEYDKEFAGVPSSLTNIT